MISATPRRVRADATALIVLVGPPNRAVTWSLDGSGSLGVFSEYTDAQGRCYAIYSPGDAGDAPTISATYGV